MRTAIPFRFRRGNRFLAGNEGSVTVEFVIWIPVLLVILAFTADACLMYLVQADMWNVARDTVRRMSTGQITTIADAKTYASGQMLYSTKPYVITPTFAATANGDDIIDITLPVSQASVFGTLASFGGFSSATLEAKVTMRSES